MQNQSTKWRRSAALKAFFLSTMLLAQSLAAASEYFVSAEVMDDETGPDDAPLRTCLESAIAAGGICTLPAGTLILSTYPSPLRQEIAAGILDLNGATLRGQGPTTIIRGVSERGFDVISLNGAANFNIEDLAITSEVTLDPDGDGVDDNGVYVDGVNGISMTNGTRNIRIKRVHVYGLSYSQRPADIDGGKAFTVQSGAYNTSFPLRDIYVEQCSSRDVLIGFEMDANTNTNVEPDNINVIGNSFEGYLAGIVFSFFESPLMQTFGAAILDNAAVGGKYGIALGRGRAYYLKGNYVVLRDHLYRNLNAGDGDITSRQPLLLNDVTYITVELNTFESASGEYFLRAVHVDPGRHLFRHNNFYGSPVSRTHRSCSPSPYSSSLSCLPAEFAAYFDAAGTFY